MFDQRLLDHLVDQNGQQGKRRFTLSSLTISLLVDRRYWVLETFDRRHAPVHSLLLSLLLLLH